MTEVRGRAVSDTSASRVWEYLVAVDNWIRDLDGYVRHEENDDGTLVVTMRGKVGFMTKSSRLLVTITQREPPRIAFSLRGLDDPVSGDGELLCREADEGGTEVSYRLALSAHGMAAPVIDEFLERVVPATVGDLAATIAARLGGKAPARGAPATPAGESPTRRFLAAAQARLGRVLRAPRWPVRITWGRSDRAEPRADETFDVVVVGSGGAGLTAAIAAHDLGGRVVVIEKSQRVGGTFAYSTGLTWVPDNHHMREQGIADSREDALTYIRPRTNGRHDEEVLQSFLDHAPTVIEHLERRVGVPFEIVANYPDEQSSELGGRRHGRYLSSPLFHAPAMLGDEWARKLVLSPNFGALPMSWSEIQAAGGFGSIATWDWELLARRVHDDYRAFGMSTAGYLLAAALRRGIPIRTGVSAVALTGTGRHVTGVVTETPEGRRVLAATRGVVLATGSYDNSSEMKRNLEPHPTDSVTLGASTVDGSGLVMALELGARFAVMGGQLLIPAFHIPGEEADGAPAFRMLARESGFPGSIIVNRAGERFCDEATITELRRALALLDPHTRQYPNLPAYFVFDQQWKDRYPLGSIMPGERPEWMVRAETLEELGEALGVDVANLRATLKRFNENAAAGHDPDFGRGSSDFSRANGDPSVSPNPCLRPLAPPYYAIELRLGIVGTNGGLLINGHGQVLHLRGHPIRGLYAAGNAAANQIGGLWYNAGLMNARGMTFGYLAAHHAMGRAVEPARA